MTNLASLIFGLLAVVALVGLATDEVRARIADPGRPSPLSGMRFSDILFLLPYFATVVSGLVLSYIWY